MHHLISIFLTLLIFLAGGNLAVAKNQASSAPLGDICALAVNLSSTRTTIIPTQTQAFTVNDRLTTDTYDSNGNTLRSADTLSASSSSSPLPPPSSSVTDVYSFDNRLIRRTTPDGKIIDLTYNPDGHRLSKFITQNALTQRLVHYLTDANNPTGYAQVIEEKHPLEPSNQQLKKVSLYGHDLISTESRGVGVSHTSSIYYNYDGLGSVRSITNATGDLTETYDYDAYGTLIGLNKRNPATGLLESTDLTTPTNKPTSEFLFTGEQYDSDLHMYFLRARYLNTNTGRFHTQDTYEGRNGEPLTLHKYLYAHSNPTFYVDPNGENSLAMEFGISMSMMVKLGVALVVSYDLFINKSDGIISTIAESLYVTTLAAGEAIREGGEASVESLDRWLENLTKAFESAKSEPLTIELVAPRRGFRGIWYHYNRNMLPIIVAGEYVTTSRLPYEEAISITNQTDVNQGPFYQHVLLTKPGDVCPLPDLRPGVTQGTLNTWITPSYIFNLRK